MSTPNLLQINSADQLRAVAALWDDLWERSEVTVPTARADLVALWLETYARRAEFLGLVVQEDGRWTAALPLVGGRFRHVLSAGFLPTNGWMPVGGPLLLDRQISPEKTLDALAAGFRQIPWSVLWLDEVDLDAPRWQALLSAMSRAGIPTSVHRRYQVGRMAIDHQWQAYRTRWSQRHRRNMSRASRQLAQLGEVAWEFHWNLKPDEVAEWVGRGFEIEDRSWKGVQNSSVIQRGHLAGYTRQAEHLAQRGHLGLAFLRSNERYIAFCHGFHAKGTYHTLKIAYDPEFAAFSPGQLLFHGILEHLFADSDYHAMDTVGELTDAVASWRPHVYQFGSVMVALRSLTGRTATWFHKRWWPHLRRLRQKLAAGRARPGPANAAARHERSFSSEFQACG